MDFIRSCRLCVGDFDTLEVIGRGAFGEVKVHVYIYTQYMLCDTLAVCIILSVWY